MCLTGAAGAEGPNAAGLLAASDAHVHQEQGTILVDTLGLRHHAMMG